MRGPAWRAVIAGFVAAGFLPSDDQELLRCTVEDVQRMPQHVVAGVGERIAAWDAEAVLATFGATGTPLLYVQSGADLELADLDRLAKLVPALPWAGSSAWATIRCWPPPSPAAGDDRAVLAVTPVPAEFPSTSGNWRRAE